MILCARILESTHIYLQSVYILHTLIMRILGSWNVVFLLRLLSFCPALQPVPVYPSRRMIKWI